MSADIMALELLPDEAETGMLPSCRFTWTGTTSATLCQPDVSPPTF